MTMNNAAAIAWVIHTTGNCLMLCGILQNHAITPMAAAG
jgi:hypothetical protein